MHIGIVLSHGFAGRELLYSGVATTLQAAGHRVSLLAASSLSSDVVSWAESREMHITPIDDRRLFREYYWHQFRKQLFLRYRPTVVVQRLNDTLRRENPVINTLFAVGTRLLLGRPRLQSSYCRVERMIYRAPKISRLIRGLALDLVIVTTPGLYVADLRVLRAVCRKRTLTMCVLLSWDILTAKGLFAERVDRWTVWGETGRQELVGLHYCRPDQIEICGAAHFDVYADRERIGPRDEILAQMGLNPGARTLFVGLGPSDYYGDQPALVADLVHVAKQLDTPIQLICRVHPQFAPPDLVEALQAILEAAEMPFFLDIPALHQASAEGRVQEDDSLRLARALSASDVTVNIASTLSLDALALDKPVVNIGYDVNGIPQASGSSAASLYDYPHYSKIVETGAVRVAWSREELLECIASYLRRPGLEGAERREAVSRFLHKVDGRSKARIVDAILRFLAAGQGSSTPHVGVVNDR